MGCGPSSASNAANPSRNPPAAGLQQREPRIAGGNPQNRRLRLPSPWSAPDPVSVTALNNKRSTFWETAPQAGGSSNVWEALRVISESLINNDAELATTLVQAADLRVPHADLSVVFDARGRLYEVPRFAYSNPTNLMSDAEALVASQAADASRNTEHKGPVVQLSLVVRISPSGGPTANSEQDVKMTVPSDLRVAALKTALHDKLDAGECDQQASTDVKHPNKWVGRGLPPKRQRLMVRGRELKDSQHLQEAGIESGTVLQVFVRPESV